VERIKQAIEKAKVADTGDKPDVPKTPDTDLGQTVDVSDITYRRTRVVQLDPRHLEERRIIALNKNDIGAMSFDILRTQVLRKMSDNGWRTLAITSPTPDCGKTVVAINLAISIAKHTEHTVLLADFDLRSPKVAEYLGLPSGVSMIDYLEGDTDLADVFVNPAIPRLTLLPNQSPVSNASETLTTTKMKSMVSDIRDRYESRMVIFDLPPVLSTDDAMAFVPQVDCVLLVIANRQSTATEVRNAGRLLKNTNLLGTVLNKSEEGHHTYY